MMFDAPSPDDCPSRLMFAVLPTRPERLVTILEADLARGRADISTPIRAPDLLHMTLAVACVVSGPSEALLRALIAVGDRVRMRSFQIEWDRAEMFGVPGQDRAFKLLAGCGVAQATALQRCLRATMTEANWPPIDTMQPPHVTLLYEQDRRVREPIAPVTWNVRAFTLVESLVGRTEYVRHKSWPLLPAFNPADGEPLRVQQEFSFEHAQSSVIPAKSGTREEAAP
jgi:RNA 2',3'-cyclic 3'-phosphodiesterase